MKCEDISDKLMSYLDDRANSANRREVEEHLADCAACRMRAEEFRTIWKILEEVPAVEPSFGFDARVRQGVAAEPRPHWFGSLLPHPRLAFAAILLVALTVWVANLPTKNQGSNGASASTQQEDFNAIQDLGVLENFDVLTKFDALAEPAATTAPQPDTTQQAEPTAND